MKRASFVSPVVLVVAFGVAGGGCKCERDKPYVPYSIDDRDGAVALDAGATLATASATVDAAASAPPLAVTRAKPGVTTLTIEDVTVAAPPGQTFVGGVAYDWDGDGAKDVIAVLRADASTAAAALFAIGVRRSASKDGALSVVASSPPLAPPTKEEVPFTMTRRGKSSVVIEVGASIAHRSASRWLTVLATEGKAPRARFSVGVADPPGAQPLALEADAIDRDGDGIDDVVLRAGLEGAVAPFEPGPKITAGMVWLDRAAGLSRDPEEPEASFKAFVAPLAARATRPKEAALVPIAVRQLRHLAHAVCAEGGAARLVQLAGASLPSCAGSRALEDAGLAEARAAVTAGDVIRAAVSLDRAERPPSAKTPARVKETAAAIEKLAPVREAVTTRLFAAVPDEPPRDAPAWGPLAFEPDGHLLIKTKAGVVRADPKSGEEADSGRPPWSPSIGGDGHPTFLTAVSTCDGVAIRAVFNKADGAGTAEALLPIVPPLGERCQVPRGEPAAVRPLAWSSSGLEAIVGGELVLIGPEGTRGSLLAGPLDAPAPPGSAKSPDGTALVFPTSLGFALRATSGARLLRAREWDGTYAEMRHCVVGNDARRVACLRGGRVVAAIWDN